MIPFSGKAIHYWQLFEVLHFADGMSVAIAIALVR